MTKAELEANADQWNIDFREEDHQGIGGYMLHWRSGDEECCHITYAKLAEVNWQQLNRLVINGRDVTGYTRIVGYFSNTSNWNKSKIGELKDRGRGNYRVGGK